MSYFFSLHYKLAGDDGRAWPYNGGGSKEIRVKVTAVKNAFMLTRRACCLTWANTVSSSIFSTSSPTLREPRAARFTQVLSRH